ncbi:MAG: hypothetical protein HYY17_16010 [Planctomycetes bacterium]|nr:hypothetical protein [Planctomycetota bacterium]
MRLALAIAFASSLAFAAPAGPQEDPDDLKKQAQEMKGKVKEIRGLSFKKEVTVGVYSKDDLQKFIVGEFERELPRPKAKKYEKAYKHMALLPADDSWDLYDSLITLFSESIAGFYHPKTKELRLIKPEADSEDETFKQLGLDMQAVTLVHELTHAAQDQNFDLVTVPMEEEYNDDMVAAIKCLVEGEASIVGWQYGYDNSTKLKTLMTFDQLMKANNDGYKSGALPGKAGKLPAYLRLTLTFSYGYGCEFVLACHKGYGKDWEKISKMYEDLPSSTEQVLHPEKYWKERDYPTVVSIPALPEEWKLLCHNVHGEYPIRILLKELKAGSSKEIEKAAAGWDGDRYAVYERNGVVSSLWYSTWDTEEDAREFFDAYRKALGYKYKNAKETSADGPVVLAIDEKRAATIERRGLDVLVLDGDAELGKFGEKTWKGAKKQELKKVDRFVEGCWTCEKHPSVEKDVNSYCSECGERLTKRKEKKEKKEKKDYR